ncbi:MAG: ATP-binding cassette domain-containing protein [Clostridia bacterium]|nr:ATP-binding cassette domain-containing protein [Clostridia bacterium]
MIQVENLTKKYGKNVALDNVSFSLEDGDILGFLGPNGAGKSTTMNIITGYISSDSGVVKIDGIDILENPAEAKKKIGYLPEIPPLYNEMTVQKYLEFMFNLKKVRLPMKEHINKICQMVKISDVQDRIIKHLSKGYCQRVGLAQALLGDPPVLILDEATVGLDPKQIIEIRKLIKELGKKHTVILSSHVLSEVQAVCDKIVVINNGKIVADDFTSKFMQSGSDTKSLKLVIEGKETAVYSILSKVDGVQKVIRNGECERGCYEYIVESNNDVRRVIYRAIAKTDYNILVMRPVERSLEETFLDIISGNAESKGGDY